MLQLRLEETSGLGVTTVIVEARQNHQGRPKLLHYEKNADRFIPWTDRITRVVVEQLPDDPNPWVREHYQRDCAFAALQDAEDDDLLLISDIDEIPAPSVFAARPEPALTLSQMVCAFAVDWQWQPDLTSVLTTVGYARSVGSLAAVRDQRGSYPVMEDAGWHFCWLGGPEACLEKTDAFCHTEARDIVREGIKSGDFIERGLWNVGRLTPVEVDERWPAMIRERRCPESWWRPR
jgi:beta-1,4-mannosyl-glycoprotein beta-1,4-N-acetylglucosaminyltransferase